MKVNQETCKTKEHLLSIPLNQDDDEWRWDDEEVERENQWMNSFFLLRMYISPTKN